MPRMSVKKRRGPRLRKKLAEFRVPWSERPVTVRCVRGERDGVVQPMLEFRLWYQRKAYVVSFPEVYGWVVRYVMGSLFAEFAEEEKVRTRGAAPAIEIVNEEAA